MLPFAEVAEERNFAQERFDREIARGTVDGEKFITASGAIVPMFQNQNDDDELIDPGCVYCQGQGEVINEDEWGSVWGCSACNGTGKGNYTITRREQRMNQWLDMIFFTDAPRFELMDRDCCPDCGAGGCGGECDFTEEDWQEIRGHGGVIYAGTITPESIDEWVGAMESAFGKIGG